MNNPTIESVLIRNEKLAFKNGQLEETITRLTNKLAEINDFCDVCLDEKDIHLSRATRFRAECIRLREAIDHPLIRQVFGDVEDSTVNNSTWRSLKSWFNVRDQALAAKG